MNKIIIAALFFFSLNLAAQNAVDDLVLKGYKLATQEKYADAISFFKKGISLDSNCNTCLTYWGACEASLGNHKAAVDIYTRAIDKNDPQALFQRAESYYALEDMDNYCRDGHQFLHNMHHIYQDTLLQDLVKRLKPTLKEVCDSTNFAYFMHRGIAASNLGNYTASLAAYAKGLTLFPNQPILLNYQGNVLLETKNFTAAIESYERALKQEKAIADFVKGKTMYPTDADVAAFVAVTYQSIAICYAELGNMERAVEWINGAEKRFPKTKDLHEGFAASLAGIYATKGGILMNINNFKDAKICFEQMLEHNGNDPSGYFNYALCLLNENTQRVKIRRLSLNINHVKYAVQNNINIELPSKRAEIPADVLDLAMFSVNRAIKLSPKFGDAYLLRGVIQLQMGNNGAACLDFESARQLDNPQATTYQKENCK
ncbi:MAG: hypothetical protein RL757_3257 [Bacteroidota bacterium]|jgi:tetratricopeptide (TPR) repeat protein